MSDIIILPNESAKMLESLSSDLRLDYDIVCRMSLGASLQCSDFIKNDFTENNGVEVDLSTILGPDRDIIITMASHQLEKNPGIYNPNDIIKNHLIKGLRLLSELYIRTNSPMEFFKELCGSSGELYLDTVDSNPD